MIRRYILLMTLLCLPVLSACETPEYKAKINAIRSAILPTVEKQITKAKLTPGAPGFIRIFKAEAQLEFWLKRPDTEQYQLYKTYPICSYSGLLGPKLQEGDKQSPEGFYDVSEDWLWPGSQYHLAMNIGFPNEYDQAHKRTGTHLMIHGGCESEGCYAMTNKGIEEIYLLVEQSLENGQPAVPIHIFPFRMTTVNMEHHKSKGWYPFWMTLKQGYDAFERQKIPPTVMVKNGRYVFKTETLIRRRQNP